ncbi:hypothetical protein, partial [Pseudomonas aeruginosa]
RCRPKAVSSWPTRSWPGAPRGQSAPPANNAMAALFANAKQLKKK